MPALQRMEQPVPNVFKPRRARPLPWEGVEINDLYVSFSNSVIPATGVEIDRWHWQGTEFIQSLGRRTDHSLDFFFFL